MTCPAGTYTVDTMNCITLPSGIRSYSMISTTSSVVAIVLPIIVMILILFCALFIFRKSIDNNVNEFEIKKRYSVDLKEPINPIHVTRITSIK